MPEQSQKSLDLTIFYEKRNAIVICALLGFLLPMAYGFLVGFPIPRVQDEFAYLLAADTFASGRITNITPLFWHHFESPHLLLTPSYMAKYPPMQSIFLALGKLVFGHPIFGVWSSCSLAAAAVCWMMQGWTRPKLAFLGTLMMILFLGINSYWAQSYWGGMVAVTGGALFFGGFRRLFRKLSVSHTILMTIGGIILVNSRPFEGTVTMSFGLITLSIWILAEHKNTLAEKFKKIILPGAVLTLLAVSAMGYYNFQITGDFFKLPYAEHQRQYFSAPLFIFQEENSPTVGGHYRLRELSDYYTEPRFSKDLIEINNLPDGIYFRPVYALLSLLIFMPIFFCYLPLTLFLYTSLLPTIKKRKELIFICLTILFTYAFMSMATFWDQYHYSAHLTSCFYLLLIETLAYFVAISKKKKDILYSWGTYACILGLLSISFFRINTSEDDTIRYYGTKPSASINLENTHMVLDKPEKAVYFRSEMEKTLLRMPDKYLLVVSYDKDYSFDDEIVFNGADLNNDKILWAHDLGEEKNKDFLDFYSDRKILMVRISESSIEINQQPPN